MFTLNLKTPKTRRGCYRQYRALYRQCRRDFRGGLQFGMDWPTLYVCYPDRYARLKYLQGIYYSLPE